MGNTYMTHDVVAKVAAVSLVNKTVGLSVCNMDYDAEFKPSGKGDTVRVRVLGDLQAYDGPDITANGDDQYLTETYVNVQLEKDKVVPVTITNKDLTLEIEDFQKQVTDQQMIPMADAIDSYIFSTIPLVCPNIVGTPGVTPSTDEVVSDAGVRLTEMGCPYEDRSVVLNPKGRGGLAQYLKAISSPAMAEDMVKRGFITRTANMAFYESNNV